MITAATLPVAVAGDARWKVGDAGYRDRLCELIAKRVVRAYVKLGDRLQIDFEGSTSLIVSLKPEDYRAAEAVIFSDSKSEQWAAW